MGVSLFKVDAGVGRTGEKITGFNLNPGRPCSLPGLKN